MTILVSETGALRMVELYARLYGPGRQVSREVSTRRAVSELRAKGYVVVDQEIIDSRVTNFVRAHPDYEQ